MRTFTLTVARAMVGLGAGSLVFGVLLLIAAFADAQPQIVTAGGILAASGIATMLPGAVAAVIVAVADDVRRCRTCLEELAESTAMRPAPSLHSFRVHGIDAESGLATSIVIRAADGSSASLEAVKAHGLDRVTRVERA